jgi:hypothetical protein
MSRYGPGISFETGDMRRAILPDTLRGRTPITIETNTDRGDFIGNGSDIESGTARVTFFARQNFSMAHGCHASTSFGG